MPSLGRRVLMMAVVFVSFGAYSLYESPVPGPDEPTYLAKARHLWNHDWCRHDLYLQSANPHYLFSVAIGAFTKWQSLDRTAYIGRILAWLLIASGWTELVNEVIPEGFAAIWSAWVFLALQSIGHFAGEWMIGGVEGKVLGYGCMLWSLVFLMREKWMLCAVWSGLCIGFHPVVGVWSAVASIGPLAYLALERFRHNNSVSARETESWSTPSAARIVSALGVFVSISVLGALPAIAMLAHNSEADAEIADNVAVFQRLRHHLDPTSFGMPALIGYAALAVAWFALRRFGQFSKREPLLACYACVSIMIAIAGLVIGLGLKSPSLMKFYPFRLVAVALPMVVSIAIAACAVQWLDYKDVPGGSEGSQALRNLPLFGLWGLFVIVLLDSFAVAQREPRAGQLVSAERPAWIRMCSWIRTNTPPDALFLTCSTSRGFKWYAERAEYFNYKDFPQDAHSIVEWNDRRLRQSGWEDAAIGQSAAAIRALRRDTGIDYIAMRTDVPIALTPVYRNRRFAVYKLPD
jgi:hypothetical protein